MVIEDIFRAAAARRERQLKVRCGPAAFRDILTSSTGPMVAWDGHSARVAGMRVDTDEWLPAHVWRLTDLDDTLLYDCREGRPLGERAA